MRLMNVEGERLCQHVGLCMDALQAMSGDKAKDKSQVMADECSRLSIALGLWPSRHEALIHYVVQGPLEGLLKKMEYTSDHVRHIADSCWHRCMPRCNTNTHAPGSDDESPALMRSGVQVLRGGVHVP